MSLAYRADIDGLRAIAVGSVVLFHGHIPPFSGGYVGVDVFFVISGFLITSILDRDITQRRFSLVDFYDHRIRRIFPALFLVLAVVTLLAAFVLTPREMVQYANSLGPSALFFANIHFEGVLDYFGPRADDVPLLHLWSLAVEEQFYILFPVLLFALMRFGTRTFAVIALAVLTVASLVYSQITVENAPWSAFFLLPSRAWELFAGSLLALVRWPPLPQRAAGAIALAGLAAILAPVFLYSKNTVFPGLSALPPVLGSAAIIFAGMHTQQGIVQRVLGHRWFTYVGRISYSLYLWHWPLLILAVDYKGRHLTYIQAGGVILVAMVLSALSLKFVETPLRRPSALGGIRLARFGAGALAIALSFGVVALIEHHGGGFRTLSARAQAAEDAANAGARAAARNPCVNARRNWNAERAAEQGCGAGSKASAESADVVVWGDSHAGALFKGISDALAARGEKPLILSLPACPPILGVSAIHPQYPPQVCTEFNAAAIAEIRRLKPKVVIMVGRWSMWTARSGNHFWLTTSALPGGEERSAATTAKVFAYGIAHTVHAINEAGAAAFVVGQPPEFPEAPVQCVIRTEKAGKKGESCETIPAATGMRFVAGSNEALTRIAAKEPNMSLFLLSPLFCDQTECRGGAGNAFYFMDEHHLSPAGSQHAVAAPGFWASFDEALGKAEALRKMPSPTN
ncbi:acyltransferase family protein [Xanthobacter tagetidis]|nr:acyltransferase family protein [Xanthobacter tagetidis]MBB6307523.1 peptidoglycan/LPS O-acetylase OafA/YrhL [Xanthobacter tagetidis]